MEDLYATLTPLCVPVKSRPISVVEDSLRILESIPSQLVATKVALAQPQRLASEIQNVLLFLLSDANT
jgi:hypothetical protein